MRSIFLMLIVTTCLSTQAKGVKSHADYIVPTSKELVKYSRFKVKINAHYVGSKTETLSYTFPEELSGNPPLSVYLSRIDNTENEWESPEMSLSCTEVGDLFSCNVFLKKEATVQKHSSNLLNWLLPISHAQEFSPLAVNKDNVVDFLNNQGFPEDILQKKIGVLEKFLSTEPAGFLSYEFK